MVPVISECLFWSSVALQCCYEYECSYKFCKNAKIFIKICIKGDAHCINYTLVMDTSNTSQRVGIKFWQFFLFNYLCLYISESNIFQGTKVKYDHNS